jgi:hypothetical protein
MRPIVTASDERVKPPWTARRTSLATRFRTTAEAAAVS